MRREILNAIRAWMGIASGNSTIESPNRGIRPQPTDVINLSEGLLTAYIAFNNHYYQYFPANITCHLKIFCIVLARPMTLPDNKAVSIQCEMRMRTSAAGGVESHMRTKADRKGVGKQVLREYSYINFNDAFIWKTVIICGRVL